MDESLIFNGIPMDVLLSFHNQERTLFHRLVFDQDMEPISAMGVIAFWMWLESIGHPNFTQGMVDIPSHTLRCIAAEGEPCIAAIILDPSNPRAAVARGLVPTTTKVPGSPIDLGYLHKFWQVAHDGVISILNDVCPKIFGDMLTVAFSMRAEGRNGGCITFEVEEASNRVRDQSGDTRVQNGNYSILGPYNAGRDYQGLGKQFGSSTKGGLALVPLKKDASSIVPYGDGSCRGSHTTLPLQRPCMQENRATRGYQEIFLPEGLNIFPRNILNMQQQIQPNNLHIVLNRNFETSILSSNGEMGMGRLSLPTNNNMSLSTAGNDRTLVPNNNIGISAKSSPFFALLQQRSKLNPKAHIWSLEPCIPPDERTLFITFSNGYPLEARDLYDFFSRRYGCVEDIYIQEVEGDEVPLYARAVFYLQAICLRVLGGNEKAKFMIKGRHVWARRYIPKKKRKGYKDLRWWRPMRPDQY